MEHFLSNEDDTDDHKPSGLRNAIIAGASALAVVLALAYAPGLTIAFAAGVVAALWFNPPDIGEDIGHHA